MRLPGVGKPCMCRHALSKAASDYVGKEVGFGFSLFLIGNITNLLAKSRQESRRA
jgi:hypothetical protein